MTYFNKHLSGLIIICLTTWLTACESSKRSKATNENCGNGQCDLQEQQETQTQTQDPWEDIHFKASIQQGLFKGTHLNLNTLTQNFEFTMPLNGFIIEDLVVSFPRLPGLSFSIEDNGQGVDQLVVLIPVALLFQDLPPNISFTHMGLPNGEPLYGVPGGQLPAIAINPNSSNSMYLYLGAGVAALYVPMNLNVPIAILFPVLDSHQNTMGFIGYKGSGLYGLIHLPPEVAQAIDDIL